MIVLLIGCCVIFVGDFVDCGLCLLDVLCLVKSMVEVGDVFCVVGNYENKFVWMFKGKRVKLIYGLVEMKE